MSRAQNGHIIRSKTQYIFTRNVEHDSTIFVEALWRVVIHSWTKWRIFRKQDDSYFKHSIGLILWRPRNRSFGPKVTILTLILKYWVMKFLFQGQKDNSKSIGHTFLKTSQIFSFCRFRFTWLGNEFWKIILWIL